MPKIPLFCRKIIFPSFCIVFICVAVFSTPQQAKALGVDAVITLPGSVSVNSDPTNLVQNTTTAISQVANHLQTYVLDPLAWTVAKAALQSLVKSNVNSVNKGPNGTAAYSTNLASDLQAAGDTAANSFISQLQSNGSIKSPYQTSVASVVGNNYTQGSSATGFFTQNPYTMAQYSSNPNAFYNGQLQYGGLTAYMNMFSQPANNPLGAAELATNALNSVVGTAQSQKQTELNWGQGFASSRGTCNTTTTGQSQTNSASGANQLTSLLTSLSQNSGCQSSPIKTPGSTIKSSLDKSLGSGIDTMVNAHSLGELITSVLGSLINQVFTSGGLSGTSQASTAATTVTSPTTGTSVTTPAGATYFSQTDPTQAAINSNLTTQFLSTISGQISQLLQFQTNWNTINNAALAANAALSSSACTPNAQSIITTVVEPVLQQASTELSSASTGITSLQSMQTQLQAIANSTSDETTALSNISNSYTSLLATLPGASDIAFATNQSQDNSAATTSPPTLYTQMNQLSAQADNCQIHT